LEKLTSKSIYCDYNSTSPLSSSVLSFLDSGDFLYANPSSVHQLGKKSKKAIREVSDYILELFSFGPQDRFCIFHSGATEGLNSLIIGLSYFHVLEQQQELSFFYSPLDHSCVVNLCPLLEKLGVQTYELPVDETGSLLIDESIKIISNDQADFQLMSYTWVNNETGMVQSLENASLIKKKTGCVVIVDAVQSPGKVEEWRKLDSSLDAYVFSAHKFGAMKGVGFSLVRADLKFRPALIGGGQQNGLRSGTENIMGIQTIQLALSDLVSKTSRDNYFDEQKSLVIQLENCISSFINDDRMMVSKRLLKRNVNTICFVSPKIKANILMMAMDLNGLQVSSGSACSSGASLPSRVLTKLGYSNDESQGGIRLSFSPGFSLLEMKEVKKRLTLILGKYYHK